MSARKASIPRKIVVVAARLSLIVGVLTAAGTAWNGWLQHLELTRAARQLDRDREATYRCAASFDDALLRKHANEFGNVDVAKAPFNCSRNAYFFVGPSHEIPRVRSNDPTFFVPTDFPPLDLTTPALLVGAVAAVATNAVGLVLAAAWLVLTWVFVPFAGPTSRKPAESKRPTASP